MMFPLVGHNDHYLAESPYKSICGRSFSAAFPFGKVISQTRSKTLPSHFGGFAIPRAFAISGILPWCQQIKTIWPGYSVRTALTIFWISGSWSLTLSLTGRLKAVANGRTVSSGRLLCLVGSVAKMWFGVGNLGAVPFKGICRYSPTKPSACAWNLQLNCGIAWLNSEGKAAARAE